MTVSGEPLERVLAWWEKSERRKILRERLFEQDAVNPDDVIMSPSRAREHGLTSTVTFPRGNLAPQGSVIKSTAIDPSVVDADGVYRKTGPARVFTREHEAIAAIKGQGDKPIRPGDVLVLIGRGPAGAGMEEIYQITAALTVSLVRQAGGRAHRCAVLGRLDRRLHRPRQPRGACRRPDRPGARRRLDPDRRRPRQARRVARLGRRRRRTARRGGGIALARDAHAAPVALADPELPDDTRLWAALQNVGGGTWGGCVYDTDAIIAALKLGTR